MSSVSFEHPREFNLKKYDDEGRFGFGDGKKIVLHFKIEREAGLHLLESPLSTDQGVIELDDGRLEISATVIDSAMLEWRLRGFGTAVSDVRREPVDNGSR